MNILKSLLIAAALLSALAAPGSAKSIWEEINETAPLQPVFEDLNKTAPLQPVFEDLNKTAP
jgi:hypothetical protein